MTAAQLCALLVPLYLIASQVTRYRALEFLYATIASLFAIMAFFV